MDELKLLPCPFCGGDVDELGAQCNYGRKTIILNLKCKRCNTSFRFNSKWKYEPYKEAIESWNRRSDNDRQ